MSRRSFRWNRDFRGELIRKNPSSKLWTKAEDEFVMKHGGQFGDMSNQQMADELGRTKDAVSTRRGLLHQREIDRERRERERSRR